MRLFCYVILELCPKGNDPLAAYENYRTISITTSSTSGVLAGYFELTFNGESFSFPANANNWDDAACKASFESLPNIKTVKCTRGVIKARASATFTIQFRAFPIIPQENSLFAHNGNPPISSFYCDPYLITGAVGAACSVADVTIANIPGIFIFIKIELLPYLIKNCLKTEYSFCSNRGTCDFNTGICSCFAGFENSNCDSYNGGIRQLKSGITSDILDVQAVFPEFTKNVLKIDFYNRQQYSI